MSTISEKLEKVRSEIRRMTARKVTIVGVTKFQPVEKIKEAIDAGLTDLGNNYAQDGETLLETFGENALKWHFIGHIQSRKAKFLTRYSCVQSLDRIEIARDLERRCAELGRSLHVLIEINVGGEGQKSGIAPAALPKFLGEVHGFPHLRARGLMAMPPPLEPIEARRPYFRQLRELMAKHPELDTLSMGTSDDYLLAVEEGATMIRLGTTLFGPRPPKS